MDSITHTLMGLTVYGTVKKKETAPEMKKALFVAAVGGNLIPDIDIVLEMTQKGRIMQQMWHRGLSHSILMALVWSVLIYGFCYAVWRTKDKSILDLALMSVFLHIGFDSLNAWGTGLFEPFSSRRVTIGVISIVDLVIWAIMLVGFIFTKIKRAYPRYKVWRAVWVVILIHVAVQSVQGIIIHQQAKAFYEKSAISASFVPWNFSVVGKKGDTVEIYNKTLWSEKKDLKTLHSSEEADLAPLFAGNPRAGVLMQWSPFVVVVDEGNKLGIYDPRFYRNGESFLYEFIERK